MVKDALTLREIIKRLEKRPRADRDKFCCPKCLETLAKTTRQGVVVLSCPSYQCANVDVYSTLDGKQFSARNFPHQ